MGADILPLGEQMVTRAPLSLQLIYHADGSAMRAEFGCFADGRWRVDETVALACPDPTAAQLEAIRCAIEAQTAARAGNQKGISQEVRQLARKERAAQPAVPHHATARAGTGRTMMPPPC